MTAKGEKVRAEGGGWLSLLLFYSPWGKDMFRKLSFRWLNTQIATPSRWPLGPLPSSQLWLRMLLRMRSCCTHPASGERPHSPPRDPWRFIQEALLWCARNMKDARLSASCQLGNYPASLPGAAAPTEPAWPSSAQQLCRWRTWLIPRNAGLSSYSSVNDFIQRGEVTRGLVIKGLHFTVKTARLCAALQKKPFKKEERIKKEGNIQVSLAPERQSLSKRRVERTSSHSSLLFSFLSPIVGEIIIGRPMNY